MRWLGGGDGKACKEKQETDLSTERGAGVPKVVGHSPYSPQYQTIVAQGHERPSPSFGAPALVWHVGIWPRRTTESGGRCDPHDTFGLKHVEARQEFDKRRHAWISEVNERLAAIEARGRWRKGPDAATGWAKRFGPNEPALQSLGFWDDSKRIESGSVGVTLWWKDSESPSDRAGAIRVRLHCELTPDYATYSFCIDIGALWQPDPSATSARRSTLLRAIARIQQICEAPLASGGAQTVASPLLPETLPPGADDELLAARNLLYVQVWEELAAEMQCTLPLLAGSLGEVFANFRGLVLPTGDLAAGLSAPAGASAFAKFSPRTKFDADGTEANALVNAYWPLVRRITPGADYRELVACGVLNFRALYITALGASSQFDAGEERPLAASDKNESDIGVSDAVMSGAAPATSMHDSCVRPRVSRNGNNHPVRYLILTKGAPVPRQIGRVVERINAMGTLRLYALKDWEAISTADTYIRILGQDLDRITRDWSDRRALIEQLKSLRSFERARKNPRYAPIRDYLVKVDVPGFTRRNLRRLRALLLSLLTFWELKQLLRKDEQNSLLDIKHALLYEVSSELETDLIGISAALDRIGRHTVGGLHFRINRSGYHVKEFRRLLETLQVGNVQTWVSYEQFVTRGLAPAFDYVATVGTRIHSLRERLLTVSETIETSALVGQSSATRHNTAVLRQATTIMVAVLAIYLSKLAFPGVYRDLFHYVSGWLKQAFAPYLKTFADLLDQGGWVAVVAAIAALVLAIGVARAWSGVEE